jgi:hypothetical protein
MHTEPYIFSLPVFCRYSGRLWFRLLLLAVKSTAIVRMCHCQPTLRRECSAPHEDTAHKYIRNNIQRASSKRLHTTHEYTARVASHSRSCQNHRASLVLAVVSNCSSCQPSKQQSCSHSARPPRRQAKYKETARRRGVGTRQQRQISPTATNQAPRVQSPVNTPLVFVAGKQNTRKDSPPAVFRAVQQKPPP